MVQAIRIQTTIGEDRRLVIDLPPDTPTGPAELVIRPGVQQQGEVHELTPEQARMKLLNARFVVPPDQTLEDWSPLTPEERMKIGKLPPDARPSEELVDEDRGEY